MFIGKKESKKFMAFRFSFVLLLNVLAADFAFASDNCLDWFQSTKIRSASKDCFIQCGLLKTDMSNYMCSLRCEEFCESKKEHCDIDTDWIKKIKDGRPAVWSLAVEKETRWAAKEKDEIAKALSSLPNYFKKLKINGFYRFKKSIQLGNPASTDGSKEVIIYDRFFEDNKPVNVLVHELSHVIYFELSRKLKLDYLKVADWKELSLQGSESTFQTGRVNFVESDGSDSPEEDFANNVEYFLTEPNILKDKNPKIYNWIKENFSEKFTLKKECL